MNFTDDWKKCIEKVRKAEDSDHLTTTDGDTKEGRKRKMKKGESSDESDGDFWSRNPIKRLGGKDENSAMGKFYL